jgi:endonuclease/exonuclease/phosphatase family metal-dependent hydrolase
MRIAVMNLQFGVGTTKGYAQYATSAWKYVFPHALLQIEQAAKECDAAAVDIGIITEISTSPLRSSIPQVEAFRRLFGAEHFHFFASSTSRFWNEGNAIFTRYKIVETRTHKLRGGIVPRVLGEASIKVGKGTIKVFIAHLALGKRARTRQMAEIAGIVARTQGPVILGGDFNERDSLHFNNILGNAFAHASVLPSFPSWQPKHSLQRLLLSEAFAVENEYVPSTSRFSDHSALYVEAALK